MRGDVLTSDLAMHRGILGPMEVTAPVIRERARRLRRRLTRSEARLWNWLRDRKFSGFKFRRQHPVGRYVLDFYCRALKLAIEVDGSQHRIALVEYDSARTIELKTYGISVLRIPNELLIRDSAMVADCIVAAIERLGQGEHD